MLVAEKTVAHGNARELAGQRIELNGSDTA
jgi:hypothetical protein